MNIKDIVIGAVLMVVVVILLVIIWTLIVASLQFLGIQVNNGCQDFMCHPGLFVSY